MLGRLARSDLYTDYKSVHSLMTGKVKPSTVKRCYKRCVNFACGRTNCENETCEKCGNLGVDDIDIYVPMPETAVTDMVPSRNNRVSVTLLRDQMSTQWMALKKLAQCQGQDPTQSEDTSLHLDFDWVTVLVGSSLDTSLLPNMDTGTTTSDGKRLNVDLKTYECVDPNLSNIFAVGRAAGDNFVRYMPGGCLAAAHAIRKKLALI